MPLKIVTKWYGGKIRDIVLSTLALRLDELALYLEDYIKQSLSIPYPPASNPGEAPHMRTGNLMRSIKHERVGLVIRVGVESATDAVYAKYLEMGTSAVMPRPFLRPALWNNESYIVQTLGARIYGNVQLNYR